MADRWLPTWNRGEDDRYPDPPPMEKLFSAWFVAPRPEQRNRSRILLEARPATVRMTGPTTGHLVVSDPGLLRDEARRMYEVADTLELVQKATATTLFEEAG